MFHIKQELVTKLCALIGPFVLNSAFQTFKAIGSAFFFFKSEYYYEPSYINQVEVVLVWGQGPPVFPGHLLWVRENPGAVRSTGQSREGIACVK